MITIKDVARHAGVAPSTVSNFLTGNARVSDPTSKRIQEAIDELGYIPNMAARSLRVNQTHTIGLIVPDISNPFFSEIVRAIGHVSQRLKYTLLLCDSASDANREKELLENLLRQRVDGILMIHTGLRDDYLHIANQASRPIVFVDRAVEGGVNIVTDNAAGGRLAARHLLGLGHRRIGVLAGDAHVGNVQNRLQAFQDELAAQSCHIEPEHFITGAQTFETGRDVTLLLQTPQPPTAIFATNDIIALGAWRTLVEQHVSIPQDVSLIGYDNIDMTNIAVPSLTTIGQDKYEMGRQAVLALLNMVKNKETAPAKTTCITPQLIVRNSTCNVEADSRAKTI